MTTGIKPPGTVQKNGKTQQPSFQFRFTDNFLRSNDKFYNYSRNVAFISRSKSSSKSTLLQCVCFKDFEDTDLFM